jgi:hypothetical protein
MATGWLSGAVSTISGISITVSRGDGWVNPPFVAGTLPAELTAIVYVSNGVVASVAVNNFVTDVQVDTAGAIVYVEPPITGQANIETNEIMAEVK